MPIQAFSLARVRLGECRARRAALAGTLSGRTQGLDLIAERLLGEFALDRVTYASINLWATLIGSAFVSPRLTHRPLWPRPHDHRHPAAAGRHFRRLGQVFSHAHLGHIQGAAQMVTVFASAVGPLLFAECQKSVGSSTPLLHVSQTWSVP